MGDEAAETSTETVPAIIHGGQVIIIHMVGEAKQVVAITSREVDMIIPPITEATKVLTVLVVTTWIIDMEAIGTVVRTTTIPAVTTLTPTEITIIPGDMGIAVTITDEIMTAAVMVRIRAMTMVEITEEAAVELIILKTINKRKEPKLTIHFKLTNRLMPINMFKKISITSSTTLGGIIGVEEVVAEDVRIIKEAEVDVVIDNFQIDCLFKKSY